MKIALALILIITALYSGEAETNKGDTTEVQGAVTKNQKAVAGVCLAEGEKCKGNCDCCGYYGYCFCPWYVRSCYCYTSTDDNYCKEKKKECVKYDKHVTNQRFDCYAHQLI